MNIGQFTAFYPSRPFWAIKAIDFKHPNSLDNFEELMSEEVFQESNGIFSIRVCRDGLIMLRMETLETDDANSGHVEVTVKRWGEYLNYLNSFYLLLDSATIKTMNLAYFNLHEITSLDAFRVRYENGKIAGQNIALESVTSVFQMGRLRSSYKLPIPFDPQIVLRQVISPEAIASAVEQFAVLVKTPGLQKVLASFCKSIAEYKVGNFDTAILLAWFISESIILKIWRDHLSRLNLDAGAGRQRINADRLDFLTGRDFPVSSISNILELSGNIPLDLFKDVDAVRRFRNKIVHGDSRYSANAANAQLAIKTARELSRREHGIDFELNLSYSVSGL